MRLDQYISENFEFTRNRAQFIIWEKLVKVNWEIITKNSFNTKETDIIEIIEDLKTQYVSRSAVKLDIFLNEIDFSVKNFTCIDIGASTWWFTQVLLQKWASKVFAIDVGTSQLHSILKNDKRVVSLESTDIRDYTKIIEFIKNDKIDLIVGDISFISLSKITDDIIKFKSPETQLIILFKPQFEVWRINLTKTGVPKNEKVIIQALDNFKKNCKEKDLKIQKIVESGLKWEAGNKEYLIWMK